jgi:membrane-bound lytic murein transglycosylase B
MLGLYERAAMRCRGLAWPVLAAVGKLETDHGRQVTTSPAGAEGPMQLLPSTWARYGVDGDGDGHANVTDRADAVSGAAHYLCANGAGHPGQLRQALFAYNHADWYVNQAMWLAGRYGGPLPPGAVTA